MKPRSPEAALNQNLGAREDADAIAQRIEESRKQIEDEIVEMNLQVMRKVLGKTQVEVADAAKMTQAELSRAEHREDHLVSTLRRYVKALGGELEVTARLGKMKVRLVGVWPLRRARGAAPFVI